MWNIKISSQSNFVYPHHTCISAAFWIWYLLQYFQMHSSMTASEEEIKFSNTYIFMWFLWTKMSVLAEGLLKLLHHKVIALIVVYRRCYLSPSLWHGDKLPCPHKIYKMNLLFFIHRLCRLYRPISFTKFTTLLREGSKQSKNASVHNIY